MATKRKLSAISPDAEEEPVDPSDELLFYCLGGGNEVGRSCHIIQYKGKTVMLDAGMHPGKDGFSALPYFDDFDLSTVDILLISHFHVDHAAALPYVLAKTNFQGRVFMTHPTKAIYRWLISDSVRVSNTSSFSSSTSSDQRTTLYTEQDHQQTFLTIEAIDFFTTHTISSIRITPYPAGHVLGAAMFLISIAGLNILFTGDFSREEDRHLIPAEVPRGVKIDVMICESTFGISGSIPRTERETALMKGVTKILNRGGKVLMPVFAIGRAQELLLILDEYWSKHPEMQDYPIYYIGQTARKCMVVYQTYIGAMNDNIKRLFRERMAEAEAEKGNKNGGEVSAGPWDFRFVRSLRSLDRFDDADPCIMLASPGMLQQGQSRKLLERWAPSERNGVIITGYSAEGTMAKNLTTEPDQIEAHEGGRSAAGPGSRRGQDGDKPMIPRRCTIEEHNFAAHVDGVQNIEFIQEIGAPVVILVHGAKGQMTRLKSKLLSLNAGKTIKTQVYSPANCEEVRIPFRLDKMAKVVGRLAQIPPPKSAYTDDAQLMSGVLVQNGFKLSLMAPEDLKEYAGLTTTTITCKQHITLGAAGIGLIKWALEGTFGAIEEIGSSKPQSNGNVEVNGNSNAENEKEIADEEIPPEDAQTFLVMECVKVRYTGRTREIELEWEGNMMNDGIADAVMAVLLTVECSPAAVKYSSQKHSHSHSNYNQHANDTPEVRFSRLCMFLEEQFGPSITPIQHPRLPLQKLSSTPGTPLDNVKSEPALEDEDDAAELEAQELERLHNLGIPVPGLEIRVDKHIAQVWLETLEVECANKTLKERVKMVVERAVETVAPLWTVAERPKKGAAV